LTLSVAGLVFGIAGLLALIAVLPPLATRLRLPYTVFLALVGCGLGLAIGIADSIHAGGAERPIVDLLHTLGSMPITSEIFLWVFLPLLLFETSVNLDAGDLLDDLGPILVLAVLAVILCTAIAGLAVWAVTAYSLIGCLLLASIVATTDPAAVVAIFREVGAPKRLVSLVEGESLLNDAAAIAIFGAILFMITEGVEPGAVSLLRGFAWDFLGGAVAGAVLGRLAGLLVGRLDQGGPAEVTLSLALAYMSYAVSGFYLHVSGVVAVVVAGLVFGTTGRTRVAQREWQSVQTIWRQLGFWASSLIFILASMSAPATLASATWQEALALLALIVGALVARVVALFGIVPALTRVSNYQAIETPYKLVIIWGGLRGALTLALALAVTENFRLPPELRQLVAVLATGFVLFTLFVQATTLRLLIRRLGLHLLTPIERLMRARALDLAYAEVREGIAAAARSHGLDPALARNVEARIGSADRADGIAPEDDPGETLLREQVITALATVTNREHRLYVNEVASRMVSRGVGTLALDHASMLLDALRTEGFVGYRNITRELDSFDRRMRLAAWLHRRLRLHRPLAKRLAERVELFLVKRVVIEQLLGFTRERIAPLFGPRVAGAIERIQEARLERVDRALDALRLQYPQHWQEAAQQYLGRVALRLEYDRYVSMYDERLLSPQLFQSLSGDIRQRRREIDRTPHFDLGLDVMSMMRRVPLFEAISDDRLAELRRLLRPRLALPGERIVQRGMPGDAMFFITSGAVEVRLGSEPIRLGTGEFFGEMALIQRRPRTADVIALGYCQLLELNREAFRQLLRTDPEIMRQVRKVAEIRLRERPRTLPPGEPLQPAPQGVE
jgi:monovalent cation:H+ antiporter, CPA1 family